MTETTELRDFAIPFVAYTTYNGVPFVAYTALSLKAESFEDAWNQACEEGLDSNHRSAWYPDWQIDDENLEDCEASEEAIEEAMENGLSPQDSYSAWYPDWQVDDESVDSEGREKDQKPEGRKDRYDPDTRREYMREYRGFERGDRASEFLRKYPKWEYAIKSLNEELWFPEVKAEWLLIIKLFYIQGLKDEEIGAALASFEAKDKPPSRQAIAKRRQKALIQIEKFHNS